MQARADKSLRRILDTQRYLLPPPKPPNLAKNYMQIRDCRTPDVNSIVGFLFLIPYLLGMPTEIFIDKTKCLDLCQDKTGEVKVGGED